MNMPVNLAFELAPAGGLNLVPGDGITFNQSGGDWRAELAEFVTEFNKTHAAVVIGGKHRIMRELEDLSSNKTIYEFIDKNALIAIYENDQIQIGESKGVPVYDNRVRYWLKHEKSRVYRNGVRFVPGKDLGEGYFNTWAGFSIEPVYGDCSLIKQHVEEIVCDGNPELIEYFYNWCAYTLQNPAKPAGAALVLRGEKGAGKGILGHFLSAIWGKHGMHISNGAHLVGKFNGHLADTCLLFSDEAFYSGNKEHEQVLKALITEPTLAIERKGIDTIQQPNYLKVFMATNSDWAVPATRDERRFCVFDVSSARIGDSAYFDALSNAKNDPDVKAAFLHEMLNRDIKSFRTGAIPESDGLKAQRIGTLESGGKWLMHFLQSEYDDYGRKIDDEIIPRSASEFFKDYIEWFNTNKISQYQIWSNTKFGIYLGKLGYKKQRSKQGVVWVLGTLGEAVEKFERYEKLTTGII